MLANSVFKVNGKPFFTIGAQAHNSSGYSLAELNTLWKACELMEVNSCAIAVSWERFEAVEGIFDTELVTDIISECRKRGLKLVLLWFGAWKNGHMKYSPQWVKRDRSRFLRVKTHDGYEIANLSSFCTETLKADKKAFCKLIETARQADPSNDTILAVQLQNELGIVGRAVRDYGKTANELYTSPVPQWLVEKIKSASDKEDIVKDWKACGSRSQGNWFELFGRSGDEYLQALSMAEYANNIAAAAKNIWNIPIYTNVWLDKQGFDIPGVNYPSGGPVIKNIAIWRWAAPALDMICPDIYTSVSSFYKFVAQSYTREDNPLYIPETGWGVPSALNLFYAIAECGLTGVHFFGAENVVAPDGSLIDDAGPMHENFQMLNAIWPLLIKYRGSEKVKAIIQEEFAGEQCLELDGWRGVARFGGFPRGGDYIHIPDSKRERRGRGLIIQTGEKEFFLCGAGYSVSFRSNPVLSAAKVPQEDYQEGHFLNYAAVEEGYFTQDGEWIVRRIRNGDQTDFGVFLYPDNGAVRVLLD